MKLKTLSLLNQIGLAISKKIILI